MPERRRRLASCAALTAVLLVCETAHAERFVEYLHVEASSGASGGGHAALRFDGKTYHYVYAEPGLIDAIVEPNESFDFAYRALANRSIHVSRVAMSDAQYDALAGAFERRQVTEAAQLELLDAALDDQALMGHLRELRCAEGAPGATRAALRLRGTGYFEGMSASRRESAAASSSAEPRPDIGPVTELRAAIERAYGSDYLGRRSRDIARAIEALAYAPAPTPVLAEGEMPDRARSFAERYRDLATASAALDVLAHGRPPVPVAYRSLDAPRDRLTEAERAALAARSATLRASLVRLAASHREDWGYPMLVGMARLVAIDASLRSGSLVTPDSFDDAAMSVDVERLLADRPVADALLRERRDAFDDARAQLLAARPSDEAAWSRLEVATSALIELDEAVHRGNGVVRSYADTPLPSRAAVLDASTPLPTASCAVLDRWQQTAERAAVGLRDRLTGIYRYDIVARNCVTEIFRTMRSAHADVGPLAIADSRLGFIPFVSAEAVNADHSVTERSVLPSYRAYWLAELRRRDGSLRVALRESNVVTSTLRHRDDEDDVFLFYTDETPVLRPLYGAINTGIGVGASVLGLATLPFDGGKALETAVRSVVFSVPELAFVNFRKGRNGLLPRMWTITPEDGS